MADEPYSSQANNKYIRINSVNPVYQDKLQNRINIDDQRPLGDAVEAARKQNYVPDTTKGRGSWRGVVISAEPVIPPASYVHLSKYASHSNLSNIKTIYRVYIPELHLFGEPPQFNLCNGVFDKAIENKIKMYPIVIADERLGEDTLKPSDWVSVSFLDSVNYEFGVITQVEKDITPYIGDQVNKAREPFRLCSGDCQDIPFIPETDIKMKGEDRRQIVPPSLDSNELDQIVYNIVMKNGGNIIDFYLVRSFISVESAGNQFALSNTGCAGYGQFCFSTAARYSDVFIGEKQTKNSLISAPVASGGLLRYFEGPTGRLYESIRSKSPSEKDIMQSVAMNFFGGSTASLVRGEPKRNQTAGNDYIKFLKTGVVTPAMEAVLNKNGIIPDGQLENLNTFLRENEPYNAFLDSKSRKSQLGFKIVPKSDARFDGQKNILAMFKLVGTLRRTATIMDNPYALYMAYNAGPGEQQTVMRNILIKTSGALNFQYPSQKFWNSEVFESVAQQVPGKNSILRNSRGGIGKYSDYVKKIYPVLDREIKRLKKTYNAKIIVS